MKESLRPLQVCHVVETLDLLGQPYEEITATPLAELQEKLVQRNRIMKGVSPGRYTAMVKLIASGTFDPAQDLWSGMPIEAIRTLVAKHGIKALSQ